MKPQLISLLSLLSQPLPGPLTPNHTHSHLPTHTHGHTQPFKGTGFLLKWPVSHMVFIWFGAFDNRRNSSTSKNTLWAVSSKTELGVVYILRPVQKLETIWSWTNSKVWHTCPGTCRWKAGGRGHGTWESFQLYKNESLRNKLLLAPELF